MIAKVIAWSALILAVLNVWIQLALLEIDHEKKPRLWHKMATIEGPVRLLTYLFLYTTVILVVAS